MLSFLVNLRAVVHVFVVETVLLSSFRLYQEKSLKSLGKLFDGQSGLIWTERDPDLGIQSKLIEWSLNQLFCGDPGIKAKKEFIPVLIQCLINQSLSGHRFRESSFLLKVRHRLAVFLIGWQQSLHVNKSNNSSVKHVLIYSGLCTCYVSNEIYLCFLTLLESTEPILVFEIAAPSKHSLISLSCNPWRALQGKINSWRKCKRTPMAKRCFYVQLERSIN